MSEPATEEPITKTEDVKEEVKDNGAEAKPADNAEGADAEKPSDATGPKEETEGDATGDGDEDAPTLVEAKPNSEDGKMIKDLDDEAPRTFPQVLMDILSHEEDSDTISWLPHGRSFIIYKKKKFGANVLPRFFKATKFTSFTRKLNRWGFTRVTRGPEMGSYYHKLFLREDTSLCLRMSSHSTSKFQESQQQLMPAPMAPMPFGMPMAFGMPGMQPMMPGMDPSQQSQFINQQLQQLQWQQFQLQQLQQQQQGHHPHGPPPMHQPPHQHQHHPHMALPPPGQHPHHLPPGHGPPHPHHGPPPPHHQQQPPPGHPMPPPQGPSSPGPPPPAGAPAPATSGTPSKQETTA